MNPLDEILQRLFQNNFSELPGLTVDASIPVPESLINELLRASLEETRSISDLHISIGAENRVDAKVKVTLLPWTLDLKFKLFKSVDLSGSPRVRAFMQNNVLLGKLGSAFRALPKGITIYEDQLSVDLGMLISNPEQRRILELVKSAEIRTEPGRLILDVRAER